MVKRISMTPIHEQIRNARKKAGLSQTELAAMIGSYKATISEIETGKYLPVGSTLQRISDALNATFTISPKKV